MTQFLEVPTGSVPSREPSCVNGMLRPVLPVPVGHLHGFRFPSLHIKNIIFLLGEPGLEYGGPYSFFPLIIFPFPCVRRKYHGRDVRRKNSHSWTPSALFINGGYENSFISFIFIGFTFPCIQVIKEM